MPDLGSFVPAVSATESLKWSPALIDVLLDELHVSDSCEELLGAPPDALRARRYPQAVAVAIIRTRRRTWAAARRSPFPLPKSAAAALSALIETFRLRGG